MSTGSGNGNASSSNTASGNARVGVQIGFVHGGTHYYGSAAENPEEMFVLGRRSLQAGAAREAERLIRRAYSAGHRTTESRLYYVLALMSARSATEIVAGRRQEELRHLLAGDAGHDEYGRALVVIRELFHHSVADNPAESMNGTLDRYRALANELRNEIARHLSRMVDGVVARHLHEVEVEDVRAGRLDDDRRRRVPKFFEADPAPPLVDLGSGGEPRRWLRAATAAWWPTCFVVATIGLVALTVGSGSAIAATLAVIGVLAAAGAAWGTITTRAVRHWADWATGRQRGRPLPPERNRMPPGEAALRFRNIVYWYYDHAWYQHRP